MLTALLAVVAAALAGASVRATAATRRARHRWWIGAVAAAGATAAVVASDAPVPIASALVAAGLAACAVVDVSDGRIPTPLAYGTTAVSTVGLLAHAASADDWGAVGRALALTAVVAAVCALLWVTGVMGFGDVRLSWGTATAMMGGVPALAVFIWVAAAVVGGMAVARRMADAPSGRDEAAPRSPRRPVPFAPGLAVAWLVGVVVV